MATTIVDTEAFRDAVHAVDRSDFRPGNALEALERATLGVPAGYRVERHELEGDVPRVTFDVFRTRDDRLVANARVRLWAGTWHVQPSPTGGVPVTPDEAQAIAYALNEAAHAARRGNDGGRVTRWLELQAVDGHELDPRSRPVELPRPDDWRAVDERPPVPAGGLLPAPPTPSDEPWGACVVHGPYWSDTCPRC